MGLFEKKEKVYEARGKKEEYKRVKSALKEAGISASGTIWQDEPPVTGCGAGLDVRDFGARGKIDRDIYTIRVRTEDLEKAGELVKSLVPDYKPYVPGKNQRTGL